MSWAKGVGQVNAAGKGFLCAYANMADDAACATVSDNIYGSATLPAAGAANTNQFLHNGQYGAADYTATEAKVTGRVTALGARVRYIGTELNRGGTVHLLETVNHESIAGYDVADIMAERSSRRVAVSRSWIELTWSPKQDTDTNFVKKFYNPDGATNIAVLGIILEIPGYAASAAACYEWEVFVHYELTGDTAGARTPSHSAPAQTGMALAALQNVKEFVTPSSVASAANMLYSAASGAAAGYRMGGPYGAVAGAAGATAAHFSPKFVTPDRFEL